jgi:hypothetical protein
MKNVRHNGKKLLITTLAIGCMALVLVWPHWRTELRAQESTPEEVTTDVRVDTVCVCHCCGRENPSDCAKDKEGHLLNLFDCAIKTEPACGNKDGIKCGTPDRIMTDCELGTVRHNACR